MMPSTSTAEEKLNVTGIQNMEEHPDELEEIVVVSDDQMQDLAQELIVDGEEIIFADEEEEFDVQYDTVVSLSNEKNLLFSMYQPEPTENGTFVCKICLRTGKNTEYPDRPSFVAHRYKCHGSFNNNVICPVQDCRQVYASLYSLRRHLGQEHDLPIEIHLQTFTNIGEFEKFRHLIELASGCRYMMHTKQPKYRRQVMHCAKSEHKLVLQTQKHRLPREKMQKEGAACPSVISYRVNAANGEVNAFMQLFHVGHAPDSDAVHSNADTARPMDVVFPLKPACWAAHAMQYVQIDVHEMPPAVYGTKIYESILIVTCLKTKFMWARPLHECTRTAIGRILNSIFNEYGVPEGFSTVYHPTYIRDTMKSLESVYSVEIREVWNEPPPYVHLERWILELSETELRTRNRWVEQLQFVIMEYNQKHIPEREETPFERMFNRKAPNLYHNGNQHDMIAAKCGRYHSELRREDEGMDESLQTVFVPGQKVFLRKGITKPRRGNNTQFYFGIIGEHDTTNQFYPFKVHYSSNDSPWPTERNMYAWVSVFDLLPTIHGISEMTDHEKQASIASYLCCCSGVESNKNFDMSAVGKPAREASQCLLFRNLLCSNNMSRYCCKTMSTEPCRFHAMYPEHDESYAKMDSVLSMFLKENKDIENRVQKELEDPEPMRRMMDDEINRRQHEGEEEIDRDDDELLPPRLERIEALHGEPLETHQEIPNTQTTPTETVSDHIDVETIDDEVLQPRAPIEEKDVVQPEFEYCESNPDEPSTSTPSKRMKRKRSPAEVEKRSKRSSITEELSPPSTTSVPSSAVRRASARKTIRPKILDDYVE
ncbi:hypothetical protein CAEBREN_17511 [Caenorhabditis brenneri]|uniref:C2H2-type domain-containing protein n=1 Tax=Caenorhabditis brenneri TaxID=135651 RepID=G0MYT6_CAEBE|nr:hypothetical protein CAEBREN_17511 [Caenorhabditis brenneri]